MAKIILKNYEELIIDDDRAVEIRSIIDEKRKYAETSGMTLNMFPIVLETSTGFWSGSLADIAQISDSSKVSQRIGFFRDTDSIKEFHKKHGYGGNQSYYEPGYGAVDVKTKYLIDIGKAKIVKDGGKKRLVIIRWEDREKSKKWSDLWEIYELNLDPFNDLVSDDKLICR